MGVHEVDRHPGLEEEREWLVEALRRRDASARHLPGRAVDRRRAGGRGEGGGGAGAGLRPGRDPLALLEAWLAVPEMARAARQALGDAGAAALPEEAEAVEAELIARTAPGLEAFAILVAANHRPA